jgi:hypothetical protein
VESSLSALAGLRVCTAHTNSYSRKVFYHLKEPQLLRIGGCKGSIPHSWLTNPTAYLHDVYSIQAESTIVPRMNIDANNYYLCQ